MAGLGCGGHSRLGTARGGDPADAERVVRAALDLGVTFIDTARAYGTEEIVGRAIAGRREEVVVCTKALVRTADGPVTPAELRASLELSLRRLGTDHVDVFMLHGVAPEDYPWCREHLVEVLLQARDEGLIGHPGISERFGSDTSHRMLADALADDVFDVVMVGFNLLNPSARRTVLPAAAAGDVGVLVMFAVRRALADPARLTEVVAGLVAAGAVDPGAVDPADPLGWVVEEAGCPLVEAAYRFCRHEPGCHVVLTGTGDVRHLRQNVAAIAGPPLPPGVLARLERTFGAVDSVSGN